MYYLFVKESIVCTWCKQPILHVIDGDPNNVIVKLCRYCDSWPKELLNVKFNSDGSIEIGDV